MLERDLQIKRKAQMQAREKEMEKRDDERIARELAEEMAKNDRANAIKRLAVQAHVKEMDNLRKQREQDRANAIADEKASDQRRTLDAAVYKKEVDVIFQDKIAQHVARGLPIPKAL